MNDNEILLAQTVKQRMIEMLKQECPDSFKYSMEVFELQDFSALDVFDAVLHRMNYLRNTLRSAEERIQCAEVRYNEISNELVQQTLMQPNQVVFEVKDPVMMEQIVNLLKKKDSGDAE